MESPDPRRGRIISRRDILKAGCGAALSIFPVACQDGTGPTIPPPPPGPSPVYALTDGTSLYDDFDGHGNLQTIDGQDLAQAGRLNAKLWYLTEGADISGWPSEDATGAAVGDDGVRHEFHRMEGGMGAAFEEWRASGRGLSRSERDLLETCLNEKGRTVLAAGESASPEREADAVRYLLCARRSVLSRRGRRWLAALKNSARDFQPAVDTAWTRAIGASAEEARILHRWLEDVRVMRSSGRDRGYHGGGPDAPLEWDFSFDARGRLAGARPRRPGEPYPSVLRWKGSVPETPPGLAEIRPAWPSGYDVCLNSATFFFVKLMLTNPEILDFQDFKTFSAEALLSSASSRGPCGAGLDFHTTIPEQPLGKSWWAQMSIVRNAVGDIQLMGSYTNRNMGYFDSCILGPAELDRWYDLRMDLLTRADDPAIGEKELRIDFYADGVFGGSLVPEDSEILLDPERTGAGPNRSLVVYCDEGAAGTVGYFDNVRAVYENRLA
jgi:hypothetical protein